MTLRTKGDVGEKRSLSDALNRLKKSAGEDPEGHPDGVEVLGYVPDMRPIVRQSAVYVVPLRVGESVLGTIFLERYAVR